MSFIKSKALFMMIILVTSVFTISLLNVNQVSAQEQKACCQTTNDGDSCVYTDLSSCNPSKGKNLATCEQTSYCKLGSCYIEAEGRCSKNVGRASCEVQQGQYFDSPECDIPDAREGCCMIGDEAFFTTQGICKRETQKFPNVEMSFDETINSEIECLETSFSEELGACVKSDGTCVLTTQQLCNEANQDVNGIQVGFHLGLLCSNPTLGTECARQQNTRCEDEDVVWVDSCGNRENIYNSNKEISYNQGFLLTDDQLDGICSANINDPDCGNCDYTTGTICGEVGNANLAFGNFICKSTACIDVTDDSSSPSAGKPKKSGESWCLYDGAVGEGRDLVGSRHYRAACINGEEIIQPCTDFREELCFESTIDDSLKSVNIQEGFTEAACRYNRYESCTEVNSINTCGGECDGLEDPFEDTPENEAQAFCCAKKACEDSASRDCYWSPSGISALGLPDKLLTSLRQQGVAGVCVPDVPPGIKFWSNDVEFVDSSTREPADISISTSSPDASETVCEAAGVECTVKWMRGGASRLLGRDAGWDVIQNEHCTRPEWVIAGNNLCKSQGDCGAYFNIVGDPSLDGYTNTASSEREKDGLYFDGYKLQNKDLGNFALLTSADVNSDVPGRWSYFTPGGALALTAIVGVSAGIKIANAFLPSPFLPGASFIFPFSSGTSAVTSIAAGNAISIGSTLTAGTFGATNANVRIVSEGGDLIRVYTGHTGDISLVAGERAVIDSGNVVAGQGVQTTAQSLAQNLFSIVGWFLWAYTIYSLIDVFLAQTEEITYQVGCGIWQPPEGGNKCELCNDDPNRPCSEYRCKSLGQQCSLVNQGTDKEECIGVNTNDVRSPVITPWRNVLGEFTITEQANNGYTLTKEIPAFTPVTLGIQTNEPAQCRVDSELGKSYNEMRGFFGSQLYVKDHQVKINLPGELADEEVLRLTNGGQHTMYIRCKDAAGNTNNRDYFIKFKVKPGPDLTPPTIRETSPLNGAFLKNDVNKTSMSVFTNEPSECRWSKKDIDFGLMENNMSCINSGFTTSALHYGLYECSTKLEGINEGSNNYFFKCKDQPNKPEGDRNTMQQSYSYTLTKTNNLLINSISPQGTLFNGNVTIKVSTSQGAENGKAVCRFSQEDEQFSNMVEFLNTNKNLHEQSLILNTGSYDYHITCRDLAGNEAKTSTSFDVAVDLSAPDILRIYSTASDLNIELDEEVDCEFGNETFIFGFGTSMPKSQGVHRAPIDNKLNIICEDIFFNQLSFVVYP